MLKKNLVINSDLKLNEVIQKIKSGIDNGSWGYYDSVFVGNINGTRMVGTISGPGMSLNVFSNRVDGEILSNSDGTKINLKIIHHYSNYLVPILIILIGSILSVKLKSNQQEIINLSILLKTFVFAIITAFFFIVKLNWDVGRLKYWIYYRLKYY